MRYEVRDGVVGDFAKVQSFLDQHLRRDYFVPVRQLREILGGRYHRTVLALAKDEVLGLGIMSSSRRTLVNLLVAPCWRKLGIADTLLSRLRVERIRVKTNVSDGDPTGYYLKHGYRMSPEKTGKKHIKIAVINLDDPPRWL